jgi:1,4-alpha-glucan branching enzyme
MLGGGTPMFMMGEEIGAQKPYRYTDFQDNREDLLAERQGNGQRLFQFYQDIIRLRLAHSGLRSHNIEIVHVHNANRVIAWRRWDETEEFLIVASLNNHPFDGGYTIEHSRFWDDSWREIFNSDASLYGGNDIGNFGANIVSNDGQINLIIPANGFIVCQR